MRDMLCTSDTSLFSSACECCLSNMFFYLSWPFRHPHGCGEGAEEGDTPVLHPGNRVVRGTLVLSPPPLLKYTPLLV